MTNNNNTQCIMCITWYKGMYDMHHNNNLSATVSGHFLTIRTLSDHLLIIFLANQHHKKISISENF